MNIPAQLSVGGSRRVFAIEPYTWSMALLPGLQFPDVALLQFRLPVGS